MKRFLALLLIMCFLIAPIASANDVWTMAESEKYGEKAGGMFGRGFVNLATCFVDIIVQTVEGTKSGPPLLGTVAGLGKGIGCTALRALSGALDLTTFWVPSFNGFPVCKSYSDCIACQMMEPPIAAPVRQVAPAVVQAPAPVPAEENPLKYVKK